MFGSSDWSIVEADESINGLDTKAKFLYYPVKYLILTSAQWEHRESYDSEKDNQTAFKELIQKLPQDGILVYNPEDSVIQKLIHFSPCPTIPYKVTPSLKSNLIGAHNQQNISAAYTLCSYLNLNEKLIIEAIRTFPGVKRRLEIVSQKNNITFIDDFAQSAIRVKTAIDAVSYTYPDRPIYVYFEPHATFLQNINSLSEFGEAFRKCSGVILSKITYSNKLNKSQRSTAADWQKIVGSKLSYLPINVDITNYFIRNLQPRAILIHFSSGGLIGLNNLDLIIKSFTDK